MRRGAVDVITYRDQAASSPIPGVRDTLTLDLPYHSKAKPARALRNLRRYWRHRPPLLDRFSNFDNGVRRGWPDATIE